MRVVFYSKFPAQASRFVRKSGRSNSVLAVELSDQSTPHRQKPLAHVPPFSAAAFMISVDLDSPDRRQLELRGRGRALWLLDHLALSDPGRSDERSDA